MMDMGCSSFCENIHKPTGDPPLTDTLFLPLPSRGHMAVAARCQSGGAPLRGLGPFPRRGQGRSPAGAPAGDGGGKKVEGVVGKSIGFFREFGRESMGISHI